MFDSMFVSIHAPRAGGDLIVGAMRIGFRVSIHAPRAGGDAALVHRCGFPDVFQSTPPARGATCATPLM